MAGARETDSSIKRSVRSPAVSASPPSAHQSAINKRERRGRIGEMGGARQTASSMKRSGRSTAATASPPSAHHSVKNKRDRRGRFVEMGVERKTASPMKRSDRSPVRTSSPPFEYHDVKHKRDSRGGIGEMHGAREAPSSLRSARSPAATSSPPFAHHSTKQKRDRRGRFARNTTKTPATRSRNVLAAEDAGMMAGIPDSSPRFTEAHCNVNRGKVAAQPCSSSIPEPREPDHRYVFIVNPKVSVHCSFSHDSDDETKLWPMPLKREIKKDGESLRVLLKRKYFKEPICISDDDSDFSL